ncbi:MAG: hypothetical protein AB7P00_04075, partial [Sandaracinaceae bacterium]
MPTPSKSAGATASTDRATLLMVGSGEPMDLALKDALDRHGLFVEAVGLSGLRDSVLLTAPDVILLVGDAARNGGQTALEALGTDSSTAAVPVVLLAPDARLESRMRAFRHGAMAVVPRSASADQVARKIVELSKDLANHFEEKTGEIGEATFDELVDLVKKELRSGILSVHAPGQKGGPTRVVLGAGRPVAEAVQEFVARLRPHVAEASPMYYQFHTSAGGPVELLSLDSSTERASEVLGQLRVLLVDNDPARADTLTQGLRARGALVFVTDESGRGLERAVGLDPQVAIVDQSGLEGPGFEVVRQIRRDPRMRWASIFVAPWGEIWPAGAPAPDIDALAAQIEPLLAPERELRVRGSSGEPFDTRLEATGPSRMLRQLVLTDATLHVTIRSSKATVEVDIAEGLIVGAAATLRPGGTAEGPAALAALLSLNSGRVHVEPRANPSVANVMSPVDEALSLASREPSPIKASRPPLSTEHVPFEDDNEQPDDSDTRIRDLSGLANAAEALLESGQRPTSGPASASKRGPLVPKPGVPPSRAAREALAAQRRAPIQENLEPTKEVVLPEASPKPEATPTARPEAESGARRRRPRQATLVMGAPVVEAPFRRAPRRPPSFHDRPTVRPDAMDQIETLSVSDIAELADGMEEGSAPLSIPPAPKAPAEARALGASAFEVVQAETVRPAALGPSVELARDDLEPDFREREPSPPPPSADMPPPPASLPSVALDEALLAPAPLPDEVPSIPVQPGSPDRYTVTEKFDRPASVDELDAVPPRRGRAGWIAVITLLMLALGAVGAVFGYRASGMHQPWADAMLARIGLAPAAPEPSPDPTTTVATNDGAHDPVGTSDVGADRGATEDGTTEDVATEDGATEHGATGDVATEDGATGDVATGDVATGDVATGDVATEVGATEDGATEDGATEDVATVDVATEDVATEDGAGGVDP